jgi:hypothetical protein
MYQTNRGRLLRQITLGYLNVALCLSSSATQNDEGRLSEVKLLQIQNMKPPVGRENGESGITPALP